jgi:TRAP-type mannitol/chloroaromatic compound transport system permease small subunit
LSYEKIPEPDAPPAEAAAGVAAGPVGWLVDGMNSLAAVLIFAVMMLMGADIVMRNALGQPIAGVAELVALSIVAILFLALPSTLRHGRMPRADIFIDRLRASRPRAAHTLEALFHLTGAVMCGVVAWVTLPLATRALEDAEFVGVEGLVTFPTWPLRAVVVAGAAVCALQYLLIAAAHARAARAG